MYLHSARLTNTNFICHGPALTRMELLLEEQAWRLGPNEILDLLTKCPAIEYVSFTTICIFPEELALDLAWCPDHSRVVVLEHLTTFILEDITAASLRLLSAIIIPPTADFHWTIIEPFGKLDYYEDDLASRLNFCTAVFNQKVGTASDLSVLMLEILPDFGGAHLRSKRDIREWPEEMRITLASCPTTATSQFVSLPALRGHILYRDLTKTSLSQRRSFAVRSRMLATDPQYLNDRWHPYLLLHPNAKRRTFVDVPEFKKVVDTFMSSVITIDGVLGADTLLIPRHGHIPRLWSDWDVTLRHLAIAHLTIGSRQQEKEVQSLAQYLATRIQSGWPNPCLESVHLPDYVRGQGSQMTQADLREDMDLRLGGRRGCAEIEWNAPYLD